MTRIYLSLIVIVSICAATFAFSADSNPENIKSSMAVNSADPTASTIPSSASASAPIPLEKQSSKHVTATATTLKKSSVVSPAPPSPVSETSSHSIIEPATGMEFLPIPAGCFLMGDNNGDSDEKPEHKVCLDAFYIGKYEVTQKQWLHLTGKRPSFFSSCGDNCPVESVSWNDAQEFVHKLNNLNGGTYRLATEAEWEYACRSGGKTERFCGGDDVNATAWYDKNSSSQPHPAGEKRSNGLGIHDMSGNVWEWVSDLYDKDYYSKSSAHNPEGALFGSTRVIRGGSWYNDARNVRSSLRSSDEPDHRSINLGFRLVYSAR